MASRPGGRNLGNMYSDGIVRKHREWRGVKDTFYDYLQWLKLMGTLAKFISKPLNVKGFFRYRWMGNYLAVPMMVDRMTEGLRGS